MTPVLRMMPGALMPAEQKKRCLQKILLEELLTKDNFVDKPTAQAPPAAAAAKPVMIKTKTSLVKGLAPRGGIEKSSEKARKSGEAQLFGWDAAPPRLRTCFKRRAVLSLTTPRVAS